MGTFLPLVQCTVRLPLEVDEFPRKRVEAVVASWGKVEFDTEVNRVLFRVPLWYQKGWHFLAPIDAGRVTASTRTDGTTTLKMELSMYRMVVVVGIMACVAGFFSHSWLSALGAFAWLGGGNWLITTYRARGRFREVVGCFQV